MLRSVGDWQHTLEVIQTAPARRQSQQPQSNSQAAPSPASAWGFTLHNSLHRMLNKQAAFRSINDFL